MNSRIELTGVPPPPLLLGHLGGRKSPLAKPSKGSVLICTRESYPSCYYSTLQDDRVPPEGDQVMSRGDTEVGQLQGCLLHHTYS